MIVLFHSALGLRAVERDIASALRNDGHDVLVPDLYGGRTADTLEHGLALKDTLGWDEIVDRARHALQDLPQDAVLAGVSMGAGVVSEVWPNRPATPAVLLIHGYAAIPNNVTVGTRAALHIAVNDRFAPDDTISRWQSTAAVRGLDAQVYRYPDVEHFYTDRSSPDYDAAAARTLLRRARAFLRMAD